MLQKLRSAPAHRSARWCRPGRARIFGDARHVVQSIHVVDSDLYPTALWLRSLSQDSRPAYSAVQHSSRPRQVAPAVQSRPSPVPMLTIYSGGSSPATRRATPTDRTTAARRVSISPGCPRSPTCPRSPAATTLQRSRPRILVRQRPERTGRSLISHAGAWT